MVTFDTPVLEAIQWQVKQLTWRLDEFFAHDPRARCVNELEHRGLIYGYVSEGEMRADRAPRHTPDYPDWGEDLGSELIDLPFAEFDLPSINWSEFLGRND